jgi:4-hydroxybenzoate polyprenyltransferase/phosphoserine phosphatase
MEQERERPLVVDLDGTLVRTDLLAETASAFLARWPLRALQLLAWWSRGKAQLKARLAQVVTLDVSALPYNRDLLAWLRAEKADGRSLVLATGSHQVLAEQVARHLGLFDKVMATAGSTNLKGRAKRDALVGLYGDQGFDYIGDDRSDVCIWKAAAQAHVVGGSGRIRKQVRSHGNLGRLLPAADRPAWGGWLAAVRPHQWLKNLLVFVPLLAAHQYGSCSSALLALSAFLVFGLAASSAYVLNDLVDVEADRRHPSKCRRPFASGELSLPQGWAAWPLILCSGLVLAAVAMPPLFTGAVVAYVLVSVGYSMWLKRIPVLDVLTLAGLYTLRIVAGAVAIRVPLSFWLLAFSMFMFLSLAFVKRYGELHVARDAERSEPLSGRGYAARDLEMVASLGATAGQISVLVLALYVQDGHTVAVYAQPTIIWLACPLLLYWVARVWMLAHRGQVHEDPVLFALRDRVSWCVAALTGAVFAVAKLGW